MCIECLWDEKAKKEEKIVSEDNSEKKC